LELEGLLLSNPWTLDEDSSDRLPPSSAIRARYFRQLTSFNGWKKILNGSINYPNLLKGLRKILMQASPTISGSLIDQMGHALAHSDLPVRILLATADNSAIAFTEAWAGPAFIDARARPNITIAQHNTASHSFAGEADAAALRAFCLESVT
jgi:hypothetical protein